MNKGILFIILGVICIAASIVMWKIGSESSHLSELKDYWYVPLPLAGVALIAGVKHLSAKK